MCVITTVFDVFKYLHLTFVSYYFAIMTKTGRQASCFLDDVFNCIEILFIYLAYLHILKNFV